MNHILDTSTPVKSGKLEYMNCSKVIFIIYYAREERLKHILFRTFGPPEILTSFGLILNATQKCYYTLSGFQTHPPQHHSPKDMRI